MNQASTRDTGMSRAELRAALSLSGIYALRMLGLFMILPVFALYAADLEGVTPALTGLAIGIYGMTQAMLQIPAGLLSDRVGRKPVIIGGLLVFAAGSLVAATADSIMVIILGRALQGAGAIAAAVMALVADLTREEHRVKAMALVGMSIGLSFALALVAGPLIDAWIGVPGIFALTAVLALCGVLVVLFAVPTPPVSGRHREAVAVPAQFARVLKHGALLRLDFGIFVLHAVLTATFVVLPLVLRDSTGIAAAAHWKYYLLALVGGIILMLPFIILAERRDRIKQVFVAAIALLLAVLLALALVPAGVPLMALLLILYFMAFNLLEAMLPSLVSRVAPVDCRGTAMGFYSSAQFLGAFAGGALGGWMHGMAGIPAVFMLAAGATLLWLLLALTMRAPARLSSYIYRLKTREPDELDALSRQLTALAGVVEAVVVAEEGVAYLKVDKRRFDADVLP